MNKTNIPTKEQLRERFSQELNIAHLTHQEQDTIITELSKIITERIITEFMLLLPEKEARKVDNLIMNNEKDAENQIMHIINTHIPDSAQIIEQIVIRTLAEFKAYTKA